MSSRISMTTVSIRAVRAGQVRTQEGEQSERSSSLRAMCSAVRRSAARFRRSAPATSLALHQPTVRTFEERLAALEGVSVVWFRFRLARSSPLSGPAQERDQSFHRQYLRQTTVLFSTIWQNSVSRPVFVALTCGGVQAALKPNTRCCSGTPSNPLIEIADIAALASSPTSRLPAGGG